MTSESLKLNVIINFEMIAEKYLPIFLSCTMSLKVMG